MCNTYCFPITTMVVLTRLVVTIYVHWLPCSSQSPSAAHSHTSPYIHSKCTAEQT